MVFLVGRYKPSHEALASLDLRDGCNKIEFCVAGLGAAVVASFSAAVLTEIRLRGICSCQETLRRNGRCQARAGALPECASAALHVPPAYPLCAGSWSCFARR
jgi:hypothetical protein